MPRKTTSIDAFIPAVRTASMRPRRDAAENISRRQRGDRKIIASMRPRRYAAETGGGDRAALQLRPASMRPRRYAAENSNDYDSNEIVK